MAYAGAGLRPGREPAEGLAALSALAPRRANGVARSGENPSIGCRRGCSGSGKRWIFLLNTDSESVDAVEKRLIIYLGRGLESASSINAG